MKKKEYSVTKNSRFSISESEKIDELVEKYTFETVSELIRESVLFFIKYLEHKDKYKDPEEMRKFAEEFDPIIKAKKNEDKMKILIGDYTDEELEQFYFICSQERYGRIKNKLQSAKDKELILECGGELVPKVGYVLGVTNDIELYRPIKPDSREWDNLSQKDKEILLLELKQKLNKLDSIPLKSNEMDYERYPRLRRIVEDVTKRISEEKEV